MNLPTASWYWRSPKRRQAENLFNAAKSTILNDMKTFVVTITLLLATIMSVPVYAVRFEINDPALPYIAKARRQFKDSVAVILNPVLCQKVGNACNFFIQHEYAHAFYNDIILPPESYPASLERRADCYAVQNITADEVTAAYKLFTDKEQLKDLPITGDPEQRAAIIKQCAMKQGNWNATF